MTHSAARLPGRSIQQPATASSKWQVGWGLVIAALMAGVVTVTAQQPSPPISSGKNVNVVGGPWEIDAITGVPKIGDPYLQRQNEPSMACSARNPLNCLAGANDYRRLDFPGVQDGKVTGDAWLGMFWTRDGGNTWRSTLLPGFLEDTSALGAASPAHGYEAAADPVVRPGTNGLLYYAGIAFNRSAIASNTAGTEGKDGVMFVARFIDDNNTQVLNTPPRYLGASAVAFSSGAKFLDKPTMIGDIPRLGSAICTIPAGNGVPAQSFPGGNLYVAYSAFMGPDDNLHTKMMFHRSTDCGQTWSAGVKLSETHRINQSSAIGIHPQTGHVFVTWREFSTTLNADQILVAVSTDFGKTFGKATVLGMLLTSTGTPGAHDQPSLPSAQEQGFRMFRTNSYPTICVAGAGTAYVAWAQRDRGPHDESRIVYSKLPNGGTVWSVPADIEPTAGSGHQLMPALACAGDRVTAIWYDQRDDAIVPVLQDPKVAFGPFLADTRPLTIPTRTIDVRAASAIDGQPFSPSIPVTRYAYALAGMGPGGAAEIMQLQFNLENLPLFSGGVIPFLGDYIDVAPSTMFLPQAAGAGHAGATNSGTSFNNKRRSAKAVQGEPNGWIFNTTAEGTPVFNAIWTDNRDVTAGGGATAPIDFTNPPCTPGTQAGSKNQNIYTSRLSGGLVAGVFGNARPLSTRQRAFSVFVQNVTRNTKKVELRIANQPDAGNASFIQFPVTTFPFPHVLLTADLAPFSAIARTVYVSGNSLDPIRVDVDEIITVNGTTTVGQQLFALINPDPTNPAPLDPSLNGAFNETHESELQFDGITEYDLTNPNFLNPNFLNPNFLNPNFLNPNFLNPTFLNPNFLNPNFLNPNFLNPNFLNPNFLNPNFLNPNFLNPNFLNTGLTTMTELSWTVDAEGNTGSSYLLYLLSSLNLPEEWATQLLIYRVYLSPSGGGIDPNTGQLRCEPGTSEQHDLLTDVLNPNFLNPNFLNTIDFSNPNFLNTALSAQIQNATFSLASGDRARIVLRVAHDGTFKPSFVTAAAVSGAVDTNDAANGDTTPDISTAQLAFAVGPNRPAAIIGTPYTDTIAVIGGTGPYTWQDITPNPVPAPGVILPMGIPLGLNFDTETGQLTGTPSHPGLWGFQIRVTDSSVPQQVIQGFFAMAVSHPLAITTTTLATAASGASYSQTLESTGGFEPIIWSIASGSLPPGITLNAATGQLSGTSTGTGTFNITFRATDSAVPAQITTRALTLVVAPPLEITFMQQPTTVTAGATMAPPVVVRVRDSAGALIPGATVTLTLGNNPTGAVLGGTLVATTTASGLAQFANLQLSRGGWNFTLKASVGAAGFPATEGFSNLFTVIGFAPTGAMLQKREGHASTLLADGRVLVTGGFAIDVEPTNADMFLNSAELFNPATNGFLATFGSMSVARDKHTATLLQDGRVLIVGGETETAGGAFVETTSVEVYNPSTNTFTAGPSLVTGRYWHTATLLADGRVVIAGGQNSAGTPLTSTAIFDPTAAAGAGSWSAGTPMSVPRSGHTATLTPAGLILFAGGRSQFTEPVGFIPTNSAEFWTNGGTPEVHTMAAARAHHTATLLGDGFILLAGGLNFVDGTIDGVDVFSSASGAGFSQSTMSLSEARHFHTATWLQTGEVVFAGGLRLPPPLIVDAPPPAFLASSELHDGSFAVSDSMDTARLGHAATRLLDGRVLITGGDDGTETTLASSELFFTLPTFGFGAVTLLPTATSADVHVGHPENQSVAQTFVAQFPAWLAALDIPAGCTGAGQAITIEIRRGDPDGTLVGSQVFPSPAGYSPGQFVTMLFDQPVQLTAGMGYAIVARAPATSTCFWRNGPDSTPVDPYPLGSGFGRLPTDTEWVAFPATPKNDMAVQVVVR